MHVRSRCFCASLTHSMISKKQQLVARSFSDKHIYTRIYRVKKNSHAHQELRHLALTQSLHLLQHDFAQTHNRTSTWRDTRHQTQVLHTVMAASSSRVLAGCYLVWGGGAEERALLAHHRGRPVEDALQRLNLQGGGRGDVTQLITPAHSTAAGVQKSSQFTLGQKEERHGTWDGDGEGCWGYACL